MQIVRQQHGARVSGHRPDQYRVQEIVKNALPRIELLQVTDAVCALQLRAQFQRPVNSSHRQILKSLRRYGAQHDEGVVALTDGRNLKHRLLVHRCDLASVRHL